MPARTASPPDLVAIGPKLLRRFYEPIALLKALVNMIPGHRASSPADPSYDLSLDAEQAFRCYVYKLAQVCDNERGGNTVTSFAVLREPDRIRYVFASNGMTPAQLNDVKAFVTSILTDLRGVADVPASGDHAAALTNSIRRDILRFNKPRLDYYLSCFVSGLGECLSRYASDDPWGNEGQSQSNESNSTSQASQEILLQRELERLEELCAFIHASDDGKDQGGIEGFLDSCLILLRYIDRVDKSLIRLAIEQKVKDGQMDRSECWHELRHFAGRLVSMYRAVDFLVDAPRRWWSLFQEDFSVEAVPPSEPAQQPLAKKSRTAQEVIGRMTSEAAALVTYRAHADALEAHGLGEELHRQCTRASFRPIVHSEVLLADWLRRDAEGGGLRASRFFNGWGFIGCSKPTCRLCQYYFLGQSGPGGAGGVEVRPAHRNLYPNWRVPDVRRDEGPQAVKARERAMYSVLVRVREDVFRMIEERVPDRKRYDSNTSSRLPRRRPGGASDFGVSDLLTSRLGALSLAGSRRGLVPMMEKGEDQGEDQGEDEDDEDGGASLA